MANGITTLTPEEIRELEMSPSDVIREKIAATGDQALVNAFDGYVGLFKGVHDGYLLQSHTALSALYKEVGPDKYLDYMHDYFYGATQGVLNGYWDKSFHDRVVAAINAPRMFHDCKMKILGEDDKKLWFVMDPCGAGQTLWEGGHYAEGSCGALCKAHPITSGGNNFPVYCTHAPIAEIISNEMNEVYIYQQDYPEQVGPCSCVFNIYRRKEDVPQSYFDRIGKKRPE